MSKWKEKHIRIVQIVSTDVSTYRVIGIGGDNMVYVWDFGEGAWEKYWKQKDVPNM